MHSDEVLEVLDAEVGKRDDPVVTDAVDPDDAVLELHFAGDVRQSAASLLAFTGGGIPSRSPQASGPSA